MLSAKNWRLGNGVPLHPMALSPLCVCLFVCLSVSLSICVCVYSYVDKLTEFLRLFVSVHLPRFERSPQFPVIEFLAVLFRFTFQQV